MPSHLFGSIGLRSLSHGVFAMALVKAEQVKDKAEEEVNSGDEIEVGGGVSTNRSSATSDVTCSICRRMYPVHKMVNAGDKQYPSWRDKACHAATRLLERAAESKGQPGKLRLSAVRRNKPDIFKRLVMSIRIDFEGDAPCAWDADDSLLEGEGSAKSFESIAIESAEDQVWVELVVTLMTRRQFIGHHVNFELYTRTEAEKLWTESVQNPEIFRELNEDSETVLALKMPKTWHGMHCFSKKRALHEAAEFSGEKDVACKRMRGVPDGTTTLAQLVGAQCLLSGKHVITPPLDEKLSRQSSDNAGSFISPLKVGVGDMLSPGEKGSANGSKDNVLGLNELVASASGGDEGDAASGVTDLVLVRSQVMAHARKIVQNLYDKKTTHFRMLKALTEDKLGTEHRDVGVLQIPKKLAEFEKSIASVKEAVEASGRWTQHSVQAEAKKVWQTMNQLSGLDKELGTHLEVLKKVRRQDINVASQDKRRMALKSREILGRGIVVKQGMPKTLQLWLAEKVLQATVESKDIDGNLEIRMRIEEDKFHEKFDMPMVWATSSDDEFPTSLALQGLGLEKGCKKTIQALKKHLADNEGVLHNLARLQAKGTDHDTFSGKGWLPESMAKGPCGNLTPGYLNSFGEPWLLHHKLWGFRHGPLDIPCAGMPAALRCIGGKLLVMVWSIADVITAGSVARDVAVMLEGMSSEDAVAFMSKSAMLFTMAPEEVAWLPAGSQSFMLALADNTSVLYWPWIARPLVDAMPSDVLKEVSMVHSACTGEENGGIFQKNRTALLKFLAPTP